MRLLKKLLSFLFVFALVLILARGWLYRAVVRYTALEERAKYELTDPALIESIHRYRGSRHLSMIQMSQLAGRLTGKTLSFSRTQPSDDPNLLSQDGKAHCVGYAALYTSILNYILAEQGETKQCEVSHLKGELELLGIDIHRLWKDPFFKDHDYVRIRNVDTGEAIYVDPTLMDYLDIDRVTEKRKPHRTVKSNGAPG